MPPAAQSPAAATFVTADPDVVVTGFINHAVDLTPAEPYNTLLAMYAFRGNLGRTLREFVSSQQSAGVTGDALVTLLLQAFDALAEDTVNM